VVAAAGEVEEAAEEPAAARAVAPEVEPEAVRAAALEVVQVVALAAAPVAAVRLVHSEADSIRATHRRLRNSTAASALRVRTIRHESLSASYSPPMKRLPTAAVPNSDSDLLAGWRNRGRRREGLVL
jgi:hypothetical protein